MGRDARLELPGSKLGEDQPEDDENEDTQAKAIKRVSPNQAYVRSIRRLHAKATSMVEAQLDALALTSVSDMWDFWSRLQALLQEHVATGKSGWGPELAPRRVGDPLADAQLRMLQRELGNCEKMAGWQLNEERRATAEEYRPRILGVLQMLGRLGSASDVEV